MKIYGYVIGQDFYNVDSPSLSKEMLQRAIAVVRADTVLPQANVSGNEANPSANKKDGEVAVCDCKEEDRVEEDGMIFCLKCGSKWD